MLKFFWLKVGVNFSLVFPITWLLLLTSAGLVGCSSLPDITRANERLALGAVQKARAELEQLVHFGNDRARLLLADSYLAQYSEAGDLKAISLLEPIQFTAPKAREKIVSIYLRQIEAGFRGSFSKVETFYLSDSTISESEKLSNIVDLYLDNPSFIRSDTPLKDWIAQKRLLGDLGANLDEVKLALIGPSTSVKGEELHALCKPIASIAPECFNVLIPYFAKNGDQKYLDYWLEGLILSYNKSLVDETFVYRVSMGLARLDIQGLSSNAVHLVRKSALDLLSSISSASAKARVSSASLKIEYNYASDIGKQIDLLLSEAQSGSAMADYNLGRIYLSGKRVSQNPEKAVEHFSRCLDAYPGASYYLGKIYYLGVLGQQNFEKSQQYLLTAGRSGHEASYRLLARIYSEAKGVRPNYIYAQVFGRIAFELGDDKSFTLIEMARQYLSREELARAAALYEVEMAKVEGKRDAYLISSSPMLSDLWGEY